MRKLSFLYFALLLLLAAGCYKKDFDFSRIRSFDWTPDLAVPIVRDSITFEQALVETGSDKNFYIDENGDISILFYFTNQAFILSPNDLIRIPLLPSSYSHQISPAEAQVIRVQDFFIPSVPYTLTLNSKPEIIINKFSVKRGKIRIASLSSFTNSGFLRVTIPQGMKNGVPFTAQVSPFVSGPQQDSIDLAGVEFDLTANPNQLTVIIDGMIKQSDNVNAGDQITSNVVVNINEIGKFEGYLGNQVFTPEEASVEVTAFNNAYVLGNIYFSDPQVSVTVVNSIGIPALITIEKLVAHNDASNVDYDITDKLGTNAFIDIPSPLITATQPVKKTVVFDNSNTGNSMDDLFNLKPDKVYFKVKTEVNPNGPVPNFFRDTSSIYCDLMVKLPLFGYFENLTLQDTFDFALNRQKEIEMIKFRTKIRNGLPLQARLQVYFVDSVFNRIDSLTGADNIMIEEAPVDPSTYLPYPDQYGFKDTTFYLDKSRMDNLSMSRKLVVRSVMNSTGDGKQMVKIKAAQALDLDFTAEIKLRSTINPSK